jgi:uncharacterized damage-inducible protein DinB
MLQEIVITYFNRDLPKLKAELEQYSNENNIWKVDKGIANSAGNLCLHLIGNLNHFIGHLLGGTDYVRQRELEFSQKDIPRTELLQRINDTMKVVETSLQKLGPEDFEKEYPVVLLDKPMKTGFFLVHLTTHLAYHLGQINYHRRLLDV